MTTTTTARTAFAAVANEHASERATQELREAHDIALAQARRAAQWYDAVARDGQANASDAARRVALAAYQVADDTWEAWENAILTAHTTTTTEREAHERATLAELAVADGWTGWHNRIYDVPTATDWLCAGAHRIKAWCLVNTILTALVAGSISIADARRDLGRVLP